MKRIVAVLLLCTAAACVTPQRPPTPTAAIPSIPQIPPPDLSPVAGRTIVVDAGHGGPWPGAVAPSNGVREADVNLRVAKHLAGMLGDAGANVVMTRVDDAVPVPDNAAKDLSARAEVANRSEADVFLSVHHNADVTGSGRNDLEVFYKMGDDAASLDLAQNMVYQLALRLRVEAERKLLLPGNYKVLREARVPAVLLESSYMTHPGNAAFLATDEAVQAEARAVAAGLADYFRLDPPDVESWTLSDTSDGRTQELEVRIKRGLPVDPASVRVTLEESERPGHAAVEGDRVSWVFAQPLPNGDNRLVFEARNALGVATRHPIEATVDRLPTRLWVEQSPPEIRDDSDEIALLQVEAVDALGLPVRDGTVVEMVETGATSETSGGSAAFLVPVRTAPASVTFRTGQVQASHTFVVGPRGFNTLTVVDAATGKPVSRAMLAGGDLGMTSGEGWAAVSSETRDLTIARPGYETQTVVLAAGNTDVRLVPRYNGALFGKRIALDAAYGGRSAGAIGPHGLRASDVNLDIARRTAAALREAGAEVFLTRDDDTELSEMERVMRAEEAGAQLLVSVSFGGPAENNRALDERGLLRRDASSFVGHYPGSTNGIRLSQSLAKRLGISTVTPSVAYVVQQTSAPAVLLQPASMALPEVEAQYREARARQAAATAISDAVIGYFSASP